MREEQTHHSAKRVKCRSLTLALVGLLTLGWTNPSAAWTPAGHMEIAAFAYDALPPSTRAELVELLRQHPRFEEDFLTQLPAALPPARQARWIFAWAAARPDLVRGQPEYDRSHWHYVNLPLMLRRQQSNETQLPHWLAGLGAGKYQPAARGVLSSCQQAHAAYPESHRKIQAELARQHTETTAQAAEPGWLTPVGPDEIRPALAWARRTLHDRRLPNAQRALALSWLLHLVGDAHQPLHAVALFSSVRFPFGDRGGNDITVVEAGALHGVWDAMLGTNTWLWSVSLTVEDWQRQPELQELARSARAQLDIETWLDEDCWLARSEVYTPTLLSEVLDLEADISVEPKPDAGAASRPNQDTKPVIYMQDVARPKRAQQRAVQAGARLGALLAQLWKVSAPSSEKR